MLTRNENITNIGLALLSGILFSSGWLLKGGGVIILFAWVPMLFLEERLFSSKVRSAQLFLYGSLGFLTWNILASWWISSATWVGFLTAITLNTVLMAAVFGLFHITRRKLGKRTGYISLILYWLAYEYASLNIGLSWPWLNLGNGLANNAKLIQWYEYTGVQGGSVWVILSGISCFFLIKSLAGTNTLKGLSRRLLATTGIIAIPIFLSLVIYQGYREEDNPVGVIILQPNFDPYITGTNDVVRANRMLEQMKTEVNTSIDIVIGPESSLMNVWGSNFRRSETYRKILEYLFSQPQLTLITGAEYYQKRSPEKDSDNPATPGPFTTSSYKKYDSAIKIDTGRVMDIYHKSKLVAGAEKMPYSDRLKFLGKISERFGGISGSLGTQEMREVFQVATGTAMVAPVICYESVYGEHVAEFILEGASIISILTNDGWWGDTPGYRQHLQFARLRAIETRRSIARAANTGISCFIDQVGNILQQTSYGEEGVLVGYPNLNNKITFYTKYGDWLGRIASLVSVLLVLMILSQSLQKRAHVTTK